MGEMFFLLMLIFAAVFSFFGIVLVGMSSLELAEYLNNKKKKQQINTLKG